MFIVLDDINVKFKSTGKIKTIYFPSMAIVKVFLVPEGPCKN